MRPTKRSPGQLEPAGAGKVEPQGELHAGEVLLILERGDRHPDEREERDQQEYADPGVDEDLPERLRPAGPASYRRSHTAEIMPLPPARP